MKSKFLTLADAVQLVTERAKMLRGLRPNRACIFCGESAYTEVCDDCLFQLLADRYSGEQLTELLAQYDEGPPLQLSAERAAILSKVLLYALERDVSPQEARDAATDILGWLAQTRPV